MNDVLVLVGVAFLVGIVMGMTGVGGGALMTPALIFLGIPPASAIANDLVAAAVNKSVGAAVHSRSGSPHLRLAGWLMLGSVPTAFAGAFLIDAMGTTDSQDRFLRSAIGAALLLAAATYVLRLYATASRDSRDGSRSDVQIQPIRTVALGAFGGLIVGLTSVGSGSVMMVVLLLMYPALSARSLVGTDLVQAIPLVASAAVSHVLVTGIDWSVLVPLVVGGSPGAFVGARLSSRVPQSTVRFGITVVLLLTGLVMLGLAPLTVVVIGAVLLAVGAPLWKVLA